MPLQGFSLIWPLCVIGLKNPNVLQIILSFNQQEAVRNMHGLLLIYSGLVICDFGQIPGIFFT
jgi:hypothetical protein